MLEQLVGQSLDRYQLVELLGEGGMGGVFRARDNTLQRDVAVKVMQPQGARLPNFQERFLQEARAAARLDHPGIVKVFDFGQAQSLLYIVMELIRGDNLRHKLDGLQAAGQTLPLPEAVGLVRQVCLAVDYAHRQGILHRDIKPDNIMLKPEPAEGLPYRPVLTDLGLAKLLEGVQLTVDGTSLGTPAYMSPEQAMGEKTDARSDVYSLGILLFELAVGRLPFPVQSLTEAIRRHTKEPPPPPRSLRPDLPEALERAILQALAKSAAERYPDAAAMAAALEGALAAPAPTATMVAGAGEQKTRYEQTPAQPRGPSILNQFPQSAGDPSRDRITLLAPDGSVRTLPWQGQELTIGRGPENGLALDYQNVSRQHARVQFDGTTYKVVDLNSTNGTYLASVKLLPGSPEVWTPDKALRIGDCWLRLERGAPAGTVVGMAAGAAAPAPGPKRVAAFLATSDLAVDPGSSVSLGLTILNQGPVVDHFQVSVANLPASWVPALPPLLRLLPGGKQEISLIIAPPRTPQSRAGVYSFLVRVASQDAPDQVAEATARLTVNPYAQFQAELQPQSARAGRPAKLAVANQGNTPQTYNVAWQERAEELAFRPPQLQLTVPEGQVGTAEFRAGPRKRRWIGARKVHPFAARVTSPGGEAQATGEVVSGALIPPWLPPLVILPLIALCVLLIAMIRRPPVIQSITIDPPNPLAGQPVTVHWVINNAQTVELRPLVSGLDASKGQYTFPNGLPTQTSFTLVASNRFASAEQPVAINVLAPTPEPTAEPGEPVVEEWSVTPTTVAKGQAVTIRWKVSNAESVTLQPFGTVELANEMQDTPQQTIRYTLIAVNQGKTVQKSQEVVVEVPAPGAPVVNAFTVQPNEVTLGMGGTIHLAWDVQGADTVGIEPGLGPVGPVGSRDLPAPAADTTYILVAKNAGGETRGQAVVQVVAPSPTPTITPSPTPKPEPSWEHDFNVIDNRTIYHIRVTGPGQIHARIWWSGTQSDLALIVNGRGKVGAYSRVDGPSALDAIYNVTQADTAAGEDWFVSVASFGSGKATGTIQLSYPGGPSAPYTGQFTVQPGRAASVSVLVPHRILMTLGGTIKGQAKWTGNPGNLTMSINSPGAGGPWAKASGGSQLSASYDASSADLAANEVWTVALSTGSAGANASGHIKLYYPYAFLYVIEPLLPIQPIVPGP